jgi:hypothetical protein
LGSRRIGWVYIDIQAVSQPVKWGKAITGMMRSTISG